MPFKFDVSVADSANKSLMARFETMLITSPSPPSSPPSESPDAVQVGGLFDTIHNTGRLFILVRTENTATTHAFLDALQRKFELYLKLRLVRFQGAAPGDLVASLELQKVRVDSFQPLDHRAFVASLTSIEGLKDQVGTADIDPALKFVVRVYTQKETAIPGQFPGTSQPGATSVDDELALSFDTHKIDGRDWSGEPVVNEVHAGYLFQRIRSQKYASVMVGEGPDALTGQAGLLFLDAQRNHQLLDIEISLVRDYTTTTYEFTQRDDPDSQGPNFYKPQPLVVPKITPHTTRHIYERARVRLDDADVESYRPDKDSRSFVASFKAGLVRETDNDREP